MTEKSYTRSWFSMSWPLWLAVTAVVVANYCKPRPDIQFDGRVIHITPERLEKMMHNDRLDLLMNMVHRRVITEGELGETLEAERNISAERLEEYLKELRK